MNIYNTERKTTSIKQADFIWLREVTLHKRNNLALIIPQYNEETNIYFIERLAYYNNLAYKCRNIFDLIIVDDGSTNGSLQLIENYIKINECSFFVAATSINTNKVGALSLAVANIPHELIFFSDFDTDIIGFEKLPHICNLLALDPLIMGCYFKMIPLNLNNIIVSYQTMEYSLLRIWYRYHKKDNSSTVMPGAGSLFKKDVIASIFKEHSGLRNGEDRESTVIGQRLGYKSIYRDEVSIITRTPKNLMNLIRQRVRWNLGYIETIYFEKNFYKFSVLNKTNLGLRTLFDIINVLIMFLATVIILILLLNQTKLGILIIITIISIKYFWLAYWFNKVKKEYKLSFNNFFTFLLYPFLKLFIEIPSWLLATVKFFRKIYIEKLVAAYLGRSVEKID